MNKGSKSCLSLDEAVWNTKLLAKGGQVKDEFDWVDIVSNHNQLGFFVLDQGSHMSESELDGERLGTCVLSFSALVSFILGFGLESGALVLLSFWLIFVKELEKLLGLVLIESI